MNATFSLPLVIFCHIYRPHPHRMVSIPINTVLPLNLSPFTRYYHNFRPHYRGFTAVTADLLPSPSPCSSLFCTHSYPETSSGFVYSAHADGDGDGGSGHGRGLSVFGGLLCRHVTISTPMVIFAVWLFLTIGTLLVQSCNVARVSCNIAVVPYNVPGVSCNVARISCTVAGVSCNVARVWYNVARVSYNITL